MSEINEQNIQQVYDKLDKQYDMQFFTTLVKATKCPFCKHKIEGILKRHPGGQHFPTINEKWLAHAKMTHGGEAYGAIIGIANNLFRDKAMALKFQNMYMEALL